MQISHPSWRRLAWDEVRVGWRTLLGCTLGIATGSAALPFYTAGVFVASIQHEFGWTRSNLSDAGLAWTASVVLFAPLAGMLVDRFGVRGPASAGLLALAATFFALSRLNGSLPIYIAVQVLGAATALPSTPVAFTRAVNERFQHARGAALGLTLAGTGLTAAFAPHLVTGVVVRSGWRSGFVALAATALVAAPVVWLLLGAEPARKMPPSAAATAATAVPSTTAPALPLDRATLARLLVAFFVLALGVGGYVLHMIPMLTDTGMSAPQAATIQGILGVAVVAGRIVVGLLVDHYFAPRVAAASLTLTALGMIALAVGGPSVVAPAALAIGFALGAEVDLIGYLTARYFGLARYARLYGVLYAAFVLGTGLSPVLISRIQEADGNYVRALWIDAALVLGAVVTFLTLPRFVVLPAQQRAH